MSDGTDAAAGSASIPVTDALGAVWTALEQLALSVRELAVASWHGAAAAGPVFVQQPTTLIAGIAVGLLIAFLAWLAVWMARRSDRSATVDATGRRNGAQSHERSAEPADRSGREAARFVSGWTDPGRSHEAARTVWAE